jgi:uncharacterized SAM-dependent methyltransferase
VSRPPGHPISIAEFKTDVRAGLTKPGQKELFSKYLYDDLGTALLDAITLLPEYGLTRADLRLLAKHGGELPDRCGSVGLLVELGSGSGEKARHVLPHFSRIRPLTYCPVDLSPAALSHCRRDLVVLTNDGRGQSETQHD